MALAILASASLTPSLTQAQGVTLDQYRPAETARGGFAISRPVDLGHIGLSARLDVDYALEPLRLDADVPVRHQLAAQATVALGLLDHVVVAARLPVTLVMTGDDVAGAPAARGAGLGDVALSARWVLLDDEVLGVATQLEATIPTAEAADREQDLVGEAGVSFTPEVVAELRFAPVWISANLGLRFREAAQYRRLDVRHELTWGLGVGVTILEDLLDATLEGFGATPLDDFADAPRSPVEALLGVRLYPADGLLVGVAGGAGIGDGYGAPSFRAIATVGWSDELVSRPPGLGGDDGDGARAGGRSGGGQSDSGRGPDGRGADPEGPGRASSGGASGAGPREVPDYGNLDRDGDRLVDAQDQCPLDREDHDEIQDNDGCPEEDADADQVPDDDDMCPLTPGVANAENASCNGCPALACVSEEGTIVISERIEFATGSAEILAQSEAVLTDVLAILQTNDQITRVRVEGHTDDRGRDELNRTLSRDRAASVMRWLVERGLDPARLEGWGCGELHPMTENRTRRGRQTNRRVEFHILAPPTAGYEARQGCASTAEE